MKWHQAMTIASYVVTIALVCLVASIQTRVSRIEAEHPKPPLSTLDRFESLESRTLKIEQAVEDMLRGATDCEFGVPEKPRVK